MVSRLSRGWYLVFMTGSTGVSLGAFLRSRRARLTPDDAGISSFGIRRVPGLRREELAQLAGVSSAYYTRLEQGHSTNASLSVLDAVARALQLDEDERIHLIELASPAAAPRPTRRLPVRARASLLRLINAMSDVPALILGRCTEVLGWNPLAHQLLAGHYDADAPQRPADRPNTTRMLFLDPHTRELHRNWPEEAARAVASLRLVAGHFPDDPALGELVGELSVRSGGFVSLWSGHAVRACVSGMKFLHHPIVGDLDLEFNALQLPDDSGQRVMTFTASSGSASAAALRLLDTA